MAKPGALRPRPVNQRQGAWYARDNSYQRMALFSPWTIAGFGLAVGLGLLLVYPYRTLEQRLAASELSSKPDRLTVEYLKVFLKAEPNALVLRQALVAQLVRLGSYAEAREAMQPLQRSGDLAIQRDAEWLELTMLEGEAYALPVDLPRRELAMQRVRQQLRVLAGLPELDSQRLLLLARAALAAGEVSVAAIAYQKIAARPEILAADIYAEAARAALALGNYRIAADLYFRAMTYTRMLDMRREYFLTAMRTLQSSGTNEDLIASADQHAGILINDTATLKFLARLAQSANRLDAAERYAKQLLKLSLLDRWHAQQLAGWQTPAGFYAGLNRVDNTPLRIVRIADVSGPGLPFDEEAYTLSYTIFLANRNLNDARRVAQSAVLQRPSDAGWRKRLAQINEWDAAPQAALPQWLAYARLSGDEAAWDTVLQLGSGLADIDAQVAAIAHKAGREPTSVVWLERLLQVFEASGQPERGLALLRTRLAGKSAPALRQRELALLATLAERTGHDVESLATLRQLQAGFGTDSTVALRIANNLYRANQPVAAFAELERAGAVAPVTDGNFWRAYAELARLLQNDAAAQTGYRSLLAGDVQTGNDLINLIALLEGAQPLAAAQLAEFAFASNGNARTALQALTLRARLADWAGARALLARLAPQQRQLLEQDPAFLTLRASIAQSSNDLDGALRDMRSALTLRPGDMELRAALIWMLVAKRDTAGLKKALLLWAADAENNPVLWDPYAAASMSLNRQDQALHWFRKGGFRSDDYLWLMSYAEVLDAVSQKELAWRIRRHVWLDLRNPDVLRKADPQQLNTLRDRLVAVAPLFMSGDGADRVMRALLRADIRTLVAFVPPQPMPRSGKEMLARLDQPETNQLPSLQERARQRAALSSSAPMEALLAPAPAPASRPQDDARLTATARELALAYALNRNANDLAAAWFASRFAAQLDKPLWGELSLLLAAEDRTQLNRLLDELPDWLPMYDRIEAAQRAGRPGLAQTLAFDQLARLPSDEDLHVRLTTMTTGQPASFSATMNQLTVSPLSAREVELQTSVNLTPGLKLTVALIDRQYRSLDDTALVNLPGPDRQLELTLRKQLDDGTVSATVQQRQGAGSNTGLRLDYSLTLSPAVGVAGTLGVRQLATESALLRVAAMRDGVESSVTYALSRAEYLRLGLAWHRYASQAGNVLGSGGNWNAEVGTHLRLEYPNITLRAFASGSAYRDRNQVDALVGSMLPAGTDLTRFRVLPVNERLVGISLGLGTVIETRYTRAWRPYTEFGLTHSDVSGRGYNLRAGIAGSVLGQDLMTLRGLRSSGSAASPQGSQEFGLDYQWFF
jgi:hypothetical protein